MSVAEVLAAGYAWADAHAWHFMAAAIAVPALGTPLAWIAGRGGSAGHGRKLASICVGVGLAAVALEAAAILVAHYFLDYSMLDANAVLLVAPAICLVASVAGIGLVFPLGELDSVRAASDLGLFLLAGAAALWLLSKFRGWGFIFLGWTSDAAVIAVLAALLLRRLYRRAFAKRAPVPHEWVAG
jgi:hypothetical protein